MSGWSSRNRLRPGSKHLCGQTCLHKLVDDFMARTLATRAQQAAEDEVVEQAAGADASLTSNAAYGEIESSARLITAPAPVAPVRPPLRKPVELVPMPARVHTAEAATVADEPPRYASRNWRAEAWDRERVRAVACRRAATDSDCAAAVGVMRRGTIHFSSIFSSAASSMTGTLSSRALSSLEPASSPATT